MGGPSQSEFGEGFILLTFSKTTGYTVLALACLDGPGGVPLPVQEVARRCHFSKPYLSKIFHSLTAKGLVKTKRGPGGGFLLTRPPAEVSLWEIAQAVEVPVCIGDCLLGIQDICIGWCPTHAFWQEEKKRIEKELRSRTLLEMKEGMVCSEDFQVESTVLHLNS